MKSRQIALLVLSASAAFATSVDAAVYSYFDTTFNNADWVGSVHADTSSPAATFAAFQTSLNGGSPITPPAINNTLYRQTTHNYGGGTGGAIVVSHQNTTFAWTPLPGEIATTVFYRYDLEKDDNVFGGSVGYDPAIFQGGNVYRLNIFDSISSRIWTRFSGAGIPLTQFDLITPGTGLLVSGNNPANNAAMTFGYISANSANGVAFKTSGLDNYGFQLTTVPEPTSFALIGVAGCALAMRRRRRA